MEIEKQESILYKLKDLDNKIDDLERELETCREIRKFSMWLFNQQIAGYSIEEVKKALELFFNKEY